MDYDSEEEEPLERCGHVACVFGRFMLIWGGYNEQDLGYNMLDQEYLSTDYVWLYHIDIEKWIRVETNGRTPPGTSGACAVLVDENLYVIGGHSERGNSNELYRLSLRDWRWRKVEVSQEEIFSPRDKFAAWEYDNRLYIFGGFGPNIQTFLCENGTFVLDETGRGWNNQLLYFDLDGNTWCNPRCTGDVPSPRAAHGIARVDDAVYLFGGRHATTRLNDLYSLNLLNLSWTRIHYGGDPPKGRSWHSFTALPDSSIYLYGGYTQDCQPLSDGWLFDTNKMKWRQHFVPTDRSRLWHTGCASSDGDVLIFGGCENDILSPEEQSMLSDELLIIRPTPESLTRLCLKVAYRYKDLTEKEWDTLPKTLTEILRLRSKGISQEDIDRAKQKKTCCIL